MGLAGVYSDGMAKPGLRLAFTARVKVGPAVELGTGPEGRRRMIPILSGSVEGPDLKGTVEGGGADWQKVWADGTIDLEARYVIRAEDGTRISVDNRGFRHGAPEVLARLAAGEDVPGSEYYFRTSPRFHAPAGKYAWMARTIFVCTAERKAGEVVLEFWRVD